MLAQGLGRLATQTNTFCCASPFTSTTSLHLRLRTVAKRSRAFDPPARSATTSHCAPPSFPAPIHHRLPTPPTIAIYALARALPRRPAVWGTFNPIKRPGNTHQSRHVNTSSYVSKSARPPALYASHHRPLVSRLKYPPGSLWIELMAEGLSQRRGLANKSNSHDHEHDHSSDDEHSHSHGLFHSHSHSHGHGAEGATEIIKALSGEGDRGSRITLIGLASNVVLSGAKGVAGVYLNSAALVADAAHSLSDLLGDFVTLACWKISRRPPNDAYPYGYGKFETLGTAVVSLFLVGGAAAIGLHSYTMLLDVLSPTVTTMPPGPVHDVLQMLVGTKESVGEVLGHGHSHGHGHGHGHVQEAGVLDPNAAWFALASVIIKEWMYRATKNVADDMKSPVLLANAYHHRSDAYSSLVTLFAILGTWAMPSLPLDPLGGMLVSLLILQQGASLTWGAFGDFTDAGVPASTRGELHSLVKPLLVSPAPHTLLGIRNVRAVRSGSVMFVDLTADVPGGMTVSDAHEVERRVRDVIMESRSEVKEVRVHLHAVNEGDKGGDENDNLPC